MTADALVYPLPKHPWVGLLVLTSAIGIAVASGRDYAGSWNDGSRLATVEALVDYHTLAIDNSIFVKVPTGQSSENPTPYPRDDPGLMAFGTGDKLFIAGHFYSDKSPVPALYMAGCYQAWQWCSGLTARDRPDYFCYLMTLVTSGLAYVVAVWSIFRLGGLVGLSDSRTLGLTASFALATVALPYVRYTNSHIMLLGITAALLPSLIQLSHRQKSDRGWGWQLLGLGTLAGLGYTMDLGAGPVLLVCTLALVIFRSRQWAPVAVFVVGALPWLALHHLLNYQVGGTWKPANAVAEYFNWPGCSFNPQNMTGTWNHSGVGHFLTYAAALLVGKNGFLGHNLPLFMALAAIVLLLWKRTGELPEVLFAGCCCGGIWLAYALTSNNYSGMCCSIRWFVPLLAPAYLVLAVYLRHFPQHGGDLLVLSLWSAVIAGLSWWQGPWMKQMVPFYWVWQVGALASWLAYRQWRVRHLVGTRVPGRRGQGQLAGDPGRLGLSSYRTPPAA